MQRKEMKPTAHRTTGLHSYFQWAHGLALGHRCKPTRRRLSGIMTSCLINYQGISDDDQGGVNVQARGHSTRVNCLEVLVCMEIIGSSRHWLILRATKNQGNKK